MKPVITKSSMDYAKLRNFLFMIASLSEKAGIEDEKGNKEKAIQYRLEVATIVYKDVMSWYENIFGAD